MITVTAEQTRQDKSRKDTVGQMKGKPIHYFNEYDVCFAVSSL